MPDKPRKIHPARPTACSQCPWRASNQSRRHPGGWYTRKNLLRLWNGMRTAKAPGMTCHPTDPNNPVPEGCPSTPEGKKTHECTGALILIIRELRAAEADMQGYLRRGGPSRKLTRDGILYWGVQRASGLAGTIMGAEPIPLLEDDPEISVPWRETAQAERS